VILPVETFAANGKQSLNRLSQPRGQPQDDPRSNRIERLSQLLVQQIFRSEGGKAHMEIQIFLTET
jgi:hypothetical protein